MKANEFMPGSLVELGGVKFIVLDTDDSDNTLYLYAAGPQGMCTFKKKTYLQSELSEAMIDWFHKFICKIGTKYLVMSEWDENGDKFMDLCAPLPAYDAKKYLKYIEPHVREGQGRSFLLGYLKDEDVEPPIAQVRHPANKPLTAGVRPALWVNADIFNKE